MKLITLNTWGGRAGKEALLQFFSKYSDSDVFCLQEIWNGGEEMLGEKAGGSKLVGVETTIYEDIAKVLPDHAAYFRPQFRDYYGLALFVRKSMKVRKEDEIFVYEKKGLYLQRRMEIMLATYNTRSSSERDMSSRLLTCTDFGTERVRMTAKRGLFSLIRSPSLCSHKSNR